MGRIIASFVVRNEERRWFDSVLSHTSNFVDDIFVYDDRSSDGTADLARRYTDHVIIRPPTAASFSEHEAKFRRRATEVMASVMRLTEDDWVLSLDADEFFVARSDGEYRTLEKMVKWCEAGGFNSMNINIPEIWEMGDRYWMNRIDGFWDKNSAPRLYRWQPNPVFINKEMGCGSVPTYALKNVQKSMALADILHVGYVVEDERWSKYEHYRSIKNNGHNPKHIQSIIARPRLKEFHRRTPNAWRGVRCGTL